MHLPTSFWTDISTSPTWIKHYSLHHYPNFQTKSTCEVSLYKSYFEHHCLSQSLVFDLIFCLPNFRVNNNSRLEGTLVFCRIPDRPYHSKLYDTGAQINWNGIWILENTTFAQGFSFFGNEKGEISTGPTNSDKVPNFLMILNNWAQVLIM